LFSFIFGIFLGLLLSILLYLIFLFFFLNFFLNHLFILIYNFNKSRRLILLLEVSIDPIGATAISIGHDIDPILKVGPTDIETFLFGISPNVKDLLRVAIGALAHDKDAEHCWVGDVGHLKDHVALGLASPYPILANGPIDVLEPAPGVAEATPFIELC
jgi:hypothetical protein